MHGLFEFILRHGYLVLLGWVFIDQLGIPLPSFPVLLAAGALAGTGRLSFLTSLLICMLAALTADTVWYNLGRTRGIRILQFLCRISLEPDSCVRRTEGIFAKQGARSLLIAKFLPGLSTVAPPLAGIFHMRFRRFALYDALGAGLWAGSILGAGFAFSQQIEALEQHALALGRGLVALVTGALAAYILYKFWMRRRFLRELRISRISAQELKEKIDAGEDLVIVDLRHSLDFEADPETIPGAFRMDAKDLEQKSDRLPPGREVILYCT
jgi:membrane protein DedA with SNARE-associated domain